MSIDIRCVNCDQKISIPKEQVGERVKCPKCYQVIVLPGGPIEQRKKDSSSLPATDELSEYRQQAIGAAVIGGSVLLIIGGMWLFETYGAWGRCIMWD